MQPVLIANDNQINILIVLTNLHLFIYKKSAFISILDRLIMEKLSKSLETWIHSRIIIRTQNSEKELKLAFENSDSKKCYIIEIHIQECGQTYVFVKFEKWNAHKGKIKGNSKFNFKIWRKKIAKKNYGTQAQLHFSCE